MPKARWSQNNWTSGLLSPLLKARSDLSWRGAGLSEAENAFSDIRGPLTRAPALTYAGDASDFLGGAMFNLTYDQEPHLLLIGPRQMQIRRRGLREWETVWTSVSEWLSNIDKIAVVQSVDLVFLFHPFVPPKTLSRLEPELFVLGNFVFLEPPIEVSPPPLNLTKVPKKVPKKVPTDPNVPVDENDPSTYTETVVDPDDPSTYDEVPVDENDPSTYEEVWQDKVPKVLPRERFRWRAVSLGDTGFGPWFYGPDPLSETLKQEHPLSDGGIYAKETTSDGYFTIDLNNPDTYTQTVVDPNDPSTYDLVDRRPSDIKIDLEDDTTFTQREWFDMKTTFPTTGVLVQGRLFIASRHIPNRIFGSAPDAYRVFPYGAEDDDGIDLLVASRSAFSIETLKTDGKRILALTSGGGYVLSPGTGGLIIPSSYRIDPFINESIDPYNVTHIQDKWFVSTLDDLAIIRRSEEDWEGSGYEDRISYRQKWRTDKPMQVQGMAVSSDLLYVVTPEGIARIRVIEDLAIQAVEYMHQAVSGVTGMSDGNVVAFYDGSDFRYIAEIERDTESVGFGLSSRFTPATIRNSLTTLGRSNWLLPVQESGRRDGLTAVAYDEVRGTTQRVWFESYQGDYEARWNDGINYGRVGMGSTGFRAVHFPIVFSQEDAASIEAVRAVDLHFDVHNCTPFDVYVDGELQPKLFSPGGGQKEWIGAQTGITSLTASGDWNRLYGPVVEIRKDDLGALTILSIMAEVVVQSTDEGRRRGEWG